MPKRAIVSVINDLSTDQRVHRTCMTLTKLGFQVTLVGRKLPGSLPLAPRDYRTWRMRLLFKRNFLFYAGYNLRLFLFLLFRRADLLVANDLDTLLPNYLVSRIKGSKLVYDTHEIFCEVPELQQSHFKKNFWKRIERKLFPKLKYVFTVNDSIAAHYEEEYGIKLNVVRNIPMKRAPGKLRTKEELGIPPGKHIILLQGAGINVDRGAEEAVEAMQYVENAVLYVIGGGDVIGELKNIVKRLHLGHQVRFVNKLPFEELQQYTCHADVGLTLDKATNINYRFSLPNKLFDYIHAGVPVLATPLAEVKKIVDKYQVGMLVSRLEPEHIAVKMISMFNREKQAEWRDHCRKASEELNWEKEEQQLIKVYSQFA